MLGVIFASQARDELDNSRAWYEGERPGLGDEFLEEFLGVLERARENPRQFPVDSGIHAVEPVRRAVLQRFPYVMVFIEVGTSIQVIAVAHAKRRDRFWRSRLS